MQGVVEPSKLCKDIFELEKDFRYNLFLLKVRDTEIARCKTQNEHLIRDLKQKEENNSVIRMKLRDLESELKSANNEKEGMKISYEETIACLNSNLKELKETHEKYVREQSSSERKRDIEFQGKCKAMLECKQSQHQQEIAEMNDRLQNEMCMTQNLKRQLEEMTTENIILRNEFQEKQSTYVSRISVLESELKYSQEERINIQMQLEAEKKNIADFETELRETITEKDKLKQELFESDECNRNLERKFKEMSEERDNLYQRLNAIKEELETYKANLKIAEKAREKLETDIECYKNVEQMECGKPEHNNFDVILKQNTVLQDVIKAMRRERNEVFDKEEIEKKVEKLEGLVKCLKDSMLNNSETDFEVNPMLL